MPEKPSDKRRNKIKSYIDETNKKKAQHNTDTFRQPYPNNNHVLMGAKNSVEINQNIPMAFLERQLPISYEVDETKIEPWISEKDIKLSNNKESEHLMCSVSSEKRVAVDKDQRWMAETLSEFDNDYQMVKKNFYKSMNPHNDSIVQVIKVVIIGVQFCRHTNNKKAYC